MTCLSIKNRKNSLLAKFYMISYWSRSYKEILSQKSQIYIKNIFCKNMLYNRVHKPLALKKMPPSSLIQLGSFWKWLLSNSPAASPLMLPANRVWLCKVGKERDALWKFHRDWWNGWSRRPLEKTSVNTPCTL